MVSPPMLEKPPTDPIDRLDEESSEGPLRVFLGLFLVPLAVILVCVAVFIGFGWVAYEHNTVSDYLNDLNSSWRPRRAQAAYELSKILIADPEALTDDVAAQAEIRHQFEEADDDVMRRYLALVLGRTGDPQAVPLLIQALDDPDSQTRIYILMALGQSGDRRSLEPLRAALGDPDAGLRKTAAWSLGELGEVTAAADLEPLLADPEPDVRWNAALALARLGSDRGVPVLREMLDRGVTGQVSEITAAQQEEAMIQAVRALAVVGGESSLSLLTDLATSDPSLKVRQAALEAKQDLDR